MIQIPYLFRSRLSLLVFCLQYFLAGITTGQPTCRCLPNDSCWPSQSKWQALNSSVSGRLILTEPLARVCHDPSYNDLACDALKPEWDYPQTHMVNPSSFVAPYFQNQSCDPFTSALSDCRLGNLVDYTINVSSAADVASGLQFAQDNNIRVVVKATGHDFLGRSTGHGALGLWMYNMKSTQVTQHCSPAYNGSAFKMGAGVLAFEAIEALTPHGLRVLTGNCPTIALAGGYTQGGGHSLLSSIHGLSADNVLEWEVVTANGTVLSATPEENTDLYWALCGGGPGTYGVVTSATVKAYEDTTMGGGNATVVMSPSSPDAFWNVVSLWHSSISALTDVGGAATYLLSNDTLDVVGIALPGRDGNNISDLMKPFVDGAKSQDVAFEFNTSTFTRYSDFYGYYFGLPYGDYPSNQVEGGRLFSRSVIEAINDNVTSTIRDIVSDVRYEIYGVALNVSKTPKPNVMSQTTTTAVPNSVLPAWRDTLLHLVIIGDWNSTGSLEANQEVETYLTEVQIPKFEVLTPNSGAYMNEGNFQQPNWKQTFYGSTYEQLRQIKRRYDPDDLFYTTVGVGSDSWSVSDDGGLCRTEG